MDAPNPRDSHWMQQALLQAQIAKIKDEVPIGAVIVNADGIVAAAHNVRESEHNPVGHAELIAIQRASQALGRWRLNDCTLYVTLEPCTMCAGAIVLARLARVVYAAHDPKAGAVGSLFNILEDTRLNHQPQLEAGVLEAEAAEMLRQFFREKRKKE
jgi:tRNA(adenine34) deaminase